MRCKSNDCDRDAWAKGYCAKHYYNAQRHGLLPRPQCKVEGCDRPSFRHQMCNTHNLRWERHGDPHVRKKAGNGETKNRVCSVDGCGQPCVARDLCITHHDLKRRRGSPTAERLKLRNGAATPERKKENSSRAQRNYYKTPHGKLRRRYATAKYRVIRGVCGSRYISKDDFLRLWNTNVCALCGQSVEDKDKTIDHIVPLSKGGTNDQANMQIAHLRCNQRKGNRV